MGVAARLVSAMDENIDLTKPGGEGPDGLAVPSATTKTDELPRWDDISVDDPGPQIIYDTPPKRRRFLALAVIIFGLGLTAAGAYTFFGATQTEDASEQSDAAEEAATDETEVPATSEAPTAVTEPPVALVPETTIAEPVVTLEPPTRSESTTRTIVITPEPSTVFIREFNASNTVLQEMWITPSQYNGIGQNFFTWQCTEQGTGTKIGTAVQLVQTTSGGTIRIEAGCGVRHEIETDASGQVVREEIWHP